jgi:hypothetical protein
MIKVKTNDESIPEKHNFVSQIKIKHDKVSKNISITSSFENMSDPIKQEKYKNEYNNYVKILLEKEEEINTDPKKLSINDTINIIYEEAKKLADTNTSGVRSDVTSIIYDITEQENINDILLKNTLLIIYFTSLKIKEIANNYFESIRTDDNSAKYTIYKSLVNNLIKNPIYSDSSKIENVNLPFISSLSLKECILLIDNAYVYYNYTSKFISLFSFYYETTFKKFEIEYFDIENLLSDALFEEYVSYLLKEPFFKCIVLKIKAYKNNNYFEPYKNLIDLLYFEPKINIYLYKYLFVEHMDAILPLNDNFTNLDDLLGYINNNTIKSNQCIKTKLKKNNKKMKYDNNKNTLTDTTSSSKTDNSYISTKINEEDLFLSEFKQKLDKQSAPREHICKINNTCLKNLLK